MRDFVNHSIDKLARDSRLVCITPASGFVQPTPALFMGEIGGCICFMACGTSKGILAYDDTLDAFGVHGVGGILGAISTGVFATLDVNPGGAIGVFYGGDWNLIVAQLAAVWVTIVLSAILSFALLKVIDWTIGLRIDSDSELQGLDLAAHSEEGYAFLDSAPP